MDANFEVFFLNNAFYFFFSRSRVVRFLLKFCTQKSQKAITWMPP